MKYCTHCGTEMMDEAVHCSNCGFCSDSSYELNVSKNISDNNISGLKTAAKIFMLMSCVTVGILLIPLIWIIPMTVSYFNLVNNNKPISIEFKICTLLFVNVIAGILMLCDND